MRVKNWAKFQHFKDRNPPWIKLYRDILDDQEWHALDPRAAKTLIALWLLASEDETKQGQLPSVKKIAFRLRVSEDEVNQALAHLEHWLDCSDITLISPGYQDDAPETEREVETEPEKELPEAAPQPPEAEQNIFDLCLPSFLTRNIAEKEARSLIGALKRDLGSESAVMLAVDAAHRKCDTSSSFRAYIATISRAEKKQKKGRVAV